MKSALEATDLKPEQCADWSAIVQAFDSFPSPKIEVGDFEDYREQAWIFRGHGSMGCLRVPSVERAAEKKSASWVVLESILLEEFRAKAPMHVDARNLPPADDRLAWLALMQHYGVPTRLLDFTYSPYVALYFALRNSRESENEPVYVLAIDAQVLTKAAEKRSQEADKKEINHHDRGNKAFRRSQVASLASFLTSREAWQLERGRRREMLSEALSPGSIRGRCFNDRGFVAIAGPTVQNARLSSQQGVFLLNGAERHSLRASLQTMIGVCQGKWCRCFKVLPDALPSIERKLFQMNIHELSLFPDIEGLAGFLRQKVRLHWDPDDPSDREQS